MTFALPPRSRASLRIAVLAGFAAMATVLAEPAAAFAADRPLAERPLPVLHVEGEGRASVAPDMAIVSFGVVREAATARQALDDNNSAMAEVVKAMKDEGIEARDLQTSAFSIQPRYTPPPRAGSGDQEPPHIVGYTVSNNLTVRVRDLSRLGAILDRAVTLGVNSGGNIQFTKADPTAIIAGARAAAMKDAAARAATLADAAGVRLGQILEITEGSVPPRPMPIARAKMMLESAPASVPVESGENTYTVTVQASWEIVE
jgi:hypothetical protein